ncbi:type II toxin-antitoxin system RelE/ParE family toxin, partial [Escherichia coli]|nr:type II toxin-antitoxin system RelE/ParE family toxin [Escherichia coli]
PFERHVIYFLQSPEEIIVIRILNQNQDASRHLHWS